MSQKVYRTAQGKTVDLGALMLKNEKVRAVGNMGVNARGDKVDNANKNVQGRNSQVNQQYRKQINNQVIDVPIGEPRNTTPEELAKATEVSKITGLDDNKADFAIEPDAKTEPNTKGGLASAIAKARQVEQEKLKTPRQEARGKKGVKKI
jgi:hypothetical protein